MKIRHTLLALALASMLLGCAQKNEESLLPEAKSDFIYARIDGSQEPIDYTYKLEKHAEELLETMTVEEKIGQMIFARCPAVGAAESAGYVGGYILFARDFRNETPQSVKEKIASWQAAAKFPLLIGVDEEGGSVVRVSRFPAFREAPFKSMLEVSAGGEEAVRLDAIEKSEFLKSLGINVNLAPVCDVPTDSKDHIYSRSFGTDAEETARLTAAVVEEMDKAEIGSVLKHFPGYGGNSDTHTGAAFDNRSLAEFEKRDFIPFISGIEAGADSVLVSHNVIEEVQQLPASLSPEIHRILRDELEFDGVVMTDDLAMEGVKGFFAEEKSIPVVAVLAGNDMIISSSPKEHADNILEAFKTGEISEGRINDAVRRILIWKMDIGLIEIEEQ